MLVGGRMMLVTLEVRYTHKNLDIQIPSHINGMMLRSNEEMTMVNG